MNLTENISIMALTITTLMLYVFAMTAMIISIKKHQYSKLWLLPAMLLFSFPPLIIVLKTYCEKSVLKKAGDNSEYIWAKLRHKAAIAIFIFLYILNFPIMLFLKYSAINADWYEIISMVCVNIVMFAFIPLYIYIEGKIRKTINKMI